MEKNYLKDYSDKITDAYATGKLSDIKFILDKIYQDGFEDASAGKTIDDFITDLMVNLDVYFQEGVIFTAEQHASIERLAKYLNDLLKDPFYKHS